MDAKTMVSGELWGWLLTHYFHGKKVCERLAFVVVFATA